MSDDAPEEDFGFGEVLSPEEIAALLAGLSGPGDLDEDPPLPDPEDGADELVAAQWAEEAAAPSDDQVVGREGDADDHRAEKRRSGSTITADPDAASRLSWLFR